MNGKNPISYTVILGSLGEIKSSQRFWCPVHACRRKFERYRFYETIICFEFQLWGFCWNFLKVTAKSNGNSNSFSYFVNYLSVYLCPRPCARKWQLNDESHREEFPVSRSLQMSRWQSQETLSTTVQCKWSYEGCRVPWEHKSGAIKRGADLGGQGCFPKEVVKVKLGVFKDVKERSMTRCRI